jgi:hypothetical protein
LFLEEAAALERGSTKIVGYVPRVETSRVEMVGGKQRVVIVGRGRIGYGISRVVVAIVDVVRNPGGIVARGRG